MERNHSERPERPSRPAGRRPRKKVCAFCVDKAEHIDYKDVAKLRRYLSERAKIVPRPCDRYLRTSSARTDGCNQTCKTGCSAAIRQRLIDFLFKS